MRSPDLFIANDFERGAGPCVEGAQASDGRKARPTQRPACSGIQQSTHILSRDIEPIYRSLPTRAFTSWMNVR